MVAVDTDVPYGMVIDFDHAVEVDTVTGEPLVKELHSKNRTGTTPFLALDLCHPPKKNPNDKHGKPEDYENFPHFHLPRYDLESFIWVLLWFLIRPRSAPESSNPPPPTPTFQPSLDPTPASESPGDSNLIKFHSSYYVPPDSEAPDLDHPPSDVNQNDPVPVPSKQVSEGSTPSIFSSEFLQKAENIPKAERDIHWWSTSNLPLAAKLKLAFASHPDTQALAEQSRSLQPLMWDLLALLNNSYTLQQRRHEEIQKDPNPRDKVADRYWFTTSGGSFTAEIVIKLVEDHIALLS